MISIDWGAFALVFGISFAAAVGIVVFYALGLRLLSAGSPDDTGDDGAVVSGTRGARPLAATVGGYACLAIGVAAVLYSLYLIIPQFH
ncbi:hypothetical protein B7R54_14725 [Subtercola boreus]|uniref:Uncharacterized protein n=1 Tax=Subtercola boreus TaxID=120213 RepID=A0A3E0VK31_9MICO|nr:hypothetical protein [Subtercola boreus]RFA10324.1 hypothetical protein B7R54_14725 [Subtercola boreus]TQL56170.1 hypothetical protein FB464_3757 [Subtercola boreus]